MHLDHAGTRSVEPEQRFEQLASPGAHETGQSDDLPGRHLEIDIREPARQCQPADAQRRDALPLPRGRRLYLLECATHHEVDQLRPVELVDGRFGDGLAVAQNGDAVGEVEDLLEPM